MHLAIGLHERLAQTREVRVHLRRQIDLLDGRGHGRRLVEDQFGVVVGPFDRLGDGLGDGLGGSLLGGHRLGLGRFHGRLLGDGLLASRLLGARLSGGDLDLDCGRVASGDLGVGRFLGFERRGFALLQRRDEQVGQRAEAAIERELNLRFGAAVRDEQVLEFEPVHARPDRLELRGRDAGVALQHAQDRAAAAIELLELLAAARETPDVALGQGLDFRAAESSDERGGQARVQHRQQVLHALGLDRELVRQRLHDRSGSHSVRLGGLFGS
jgi:hypothetical protein